MKPHLVCSGVDTLLVNIYHTNSEGERVKRDLDSALAKQLDEWKKHAQGIGEPYATPWVFNDAALHMYPNGVGHGQYPWMLRTPDITLSISQGRWNGIATVRFSSEYLWKSRGLLSALLGVHAFLSDLFQDEMKVQPSEIHLCADIAEWSDIDKLDRQRNFITRSRKRTMHAESSEQWTSETKLREHSYGLAQTGFDFSRGGPMSCTIYDKTHEITHSGKVWFRDLWESRGWKESTHGKKVWRVEFRFKREALREMRRVVDGQEVFHGLEDAYELPDRLETLWAYAAGRSGGGENGEPDGWLRCVLPNKDKNRGRWPTHPAWLEVQQAFTDPTEVPEHFGAIMRKAKEDHNITKAVEAMFGYATSAAAWQGGDLANPDADLSMFLHWFVGRAEKIMKRKELDFAEEVQRKRVKFGLQPRIIPRSTTDDESEGDNRDAVE